jgi:hypothetical protein
LKPTIGSGSEIDRHGKLTPWSISGGYSCGHILVTSEDGSIDHDSWAVELNAHLEALAAAEAAGDRQEPPPESRKNPRTDDDGTRKPLGDW